MKDQTIIGKTTIKPELSRWEPVKLKVGVIGSKEEYTFVGWRAVLVTEIICHRAAMTLEGAVNFLTLNYFFQVEPKEVSAFLRDVVERDLVKYRLEKGVKTGITRRVFSSKHELKDIVSQLEIMEAT